jgi:aminoglycoside 6'-N-acetyltransferase
MCSQDSTPSPVPALHGPRLTLRPVSDADRGRLLTILGEPEVARWWRRVEWERLIETTATAFVVELCDEPAAAEPVIGMIQFTEELDPDYKFAAIDLYLSGAVHGRGLGGEAILTLLRYLIDARGHRRFVIDPAVETVRAIRSYTGVGFRPVGVMRQYERVAPGVYRDALLMDLLADELTGGPQVQSEPE